MYLLLMNFSWRGRSDSWHILRWDPGLGCWDDWIWSLPPVHPLSCVLTFEEFLLARQVRQLTHPAMRSKGGVLRRLNLKPTPCPPPLICTYFWGISLGKAGQTADTSCDEIQGWSTETTESEAYPLSTPPPSYVLTLEEFLLARQVRQLTHPAMRSKGGVLRRLNLKPTPCPPPFVCTYFWGISLSEAGQTADTSCDEIQGWGAETTKSEAYPPPCPPPLMCTYFWGISLGKAGQTADTSCDEIQGWGAETTESAKGK